MRGAGVSGSWRMREMGWVLGGRTNANFGSWLEAGDELEIGKAVWDDKCATLPPGFL